MIFSLSLNNHSGCGTVPWETSSGPTSLADHILRTTNFSDGCSVVGSTSHACSTVWIVTSPHRNSTAYGAARLLKNLGTGLTVLGEAVGTGLLGSLETLDVRHVLLVQLEIAHHMQRKVEVLGHAADAHDGQHLAALQVAVGGGVGHLLFYRKNCEQAGRDTVIYPLIVLNDRSAEQGDPLMPLPYSLGAKRALGAAALELAPGESMFAFLDVVYALSRFGSGHFTTQLRQRCVGKTISS